MKQKLVGGLLFFLLIPTLGATSSSQAEEPQSSNPASAVNQQVSSTLPSPPANSQPVEVMKVGEYQAKVDLNREAIAKIQPHEWGNRQAATVYLRNIPVLTFLGSAPQEDTKMGQAGNAPSVTRSVELAATQEVAASSKPASQADNQATHDPVWRATSVAAKLNQLFWDSSDASSITVRWEPGDRYLIQANGEDLVEINAETVLPDSTSDTAQDALQAANRLRRLLGNAPPLSEIAGRPEPEPPAISFGPVQVRLTGMASWYGPGFHGNLSASGETYDQYALTAAHRDLPFGTQVLVTNLDNGRSVVVRINDRGPFVPGRVIDLSAAAAQMLGMLNSGIAPVELEVLGSQQSVLTRP